MLFVASKHSFKCIHSHLETSRRLFGDLSIISTGSRTTLGAAAAAAASSALRSMSSSMWLKNLRPPPEGATEAHCLCLCSLKSRCRSTLCQHHHLSNERAHRMHIKLTLFQFNRKSLGHKFPNFASNSAGELRANSIVNEWHLLHTHAHTHTSHMHIFMCKEEALYCIRSMVNWLQSFSHHFDQVVKIAEILIASIEPSCKQLDIRQIVILAI